MKLGSYLVLIGVGIIIPRAVLAYVDVELDGNRHMIGDSCETKGDKLVIYRPSGAIEVNKAEVRSVQEREGTAAGDLQSSSIPDPPSQSSGNAPTVHAATRSPEKDLAKRDGAVVHQMIMLRLDRLGAVNRHDDTAVKNFDKQLKTLDAEHKETSKKLREASEGSHAAADE